MIKSLKLNTAILILIVGIVFFATAEMIQETYPTGYKWFLSLAGVACVGAAIMFLLPFFRARKVDPDGHIVNLTPIGENPEEALQNSVLEEEEEPVSKGA